MRRNGDSGSTMVSSGASSLRASSIASAVFPEAVGPAMIVSEGFTFTGDIVSDGALHVEGHVKGTVQVDSVIIGPKGIVEGMIECARLHIKGTYRGDATCDELQIDSAAAVNGTVAYRVLTAQRGAAIVGNLTVRK